MTYEYLSKKMTNKQKLLNWLRRQPQFVRTSAIQLWGTNNYINEPTRYARKLREEGWLRRLPREEMILMGFGKTAEKVYEVLPE